MKIFRKNKNKRRPGIFRIIFFSFLFACMLTAVAGFSKLHAASYAKTIEVKLKDGQDATTAIQNALDEAAKAGTKKKQALVTIPAGTYYISKSLCIGSNTYLKLDKKTTIKKNPKESVLYMLCTKGGTKGKYSDYSNITVQGGTWDTEFIHFTDTSSGSIFMFAHTNKLKILDATLCNSYGVHLIELGGVKDCTIKNCTLYGFEAPDASTEKEAIQLDICHDKKILSGGEPFDDTPCEKITVTGCEIYDYPRAVGSHIMVEGIYHKTIKITNNNFHDISKATVYGYNYTNVTIKGNTMKNVGCGIQMKTDSTANSTKKARNDGVKAMKVSKGQFKLNITGNTITLFQKESEADKDSGSSMGIFIYGSEKYPIKTVTIENNTIKCSSSGVYLRYVDSAKILNNSIDRFDNSFSVDGTKFAEDAIKLLTSSDATIKGNKISQNCSTSFENGIAIRDDSKNVEATGNTISHCTKSGLGVYDSSSLKGSENKITDSGLNGITVMSSKVSLLDSRIENSAQHGVSIQKGTSIDFTNCDIISSGSNGINIASECEAKLIGGSVESSTAKGINVMNGGKLDASGVTVKASGGKGIDIGSETTARINACTITANKANGIFVDGNTDTEISECTIADNYGNAIQLKNGKVLVTRNTITNNCRDESDGKAVAVFSGITGEISLNSFYNPNTKNEIWISDGASLNPFITSVKTASTYYGQTDNATNYYHCND